MPVFLADDEVVRSLQGSPAIPCLADSAASLVDELENGYGVVKATEEEGMAVKIESIIRSRPTIAIAAFAAF